MEQRRNAPSSGTTRFHRQAGRPRSIRSLPLLTRVHQIRYNGFLAARSKIRHLVIPDRGEAERKTVQLPLFATSGESPPTSELPKSTCPSTSTSGGASTHRTPKLQRIAWARLLKRIGYEMEMCPECGAVMKVVQCVLAAEAIRKILAARGEHSQDSPGTRPPARARSDLFPISADVRFCHRVRCVRTRQVRLTSHGLTTVSELVRLPTRDPQQ